MTKTAQDIVIRPIITEDSMDRLQDGKYTFEVEELFDVKVAKVNTISVKGKAKRMGRTMGYRPDKKKAIVTLEGDKTIEFFDGMY